MTTLTKAQAHQVFGAALLTHTRRRNSFVNMLTGAAPQSVKKDKNRGKTQTEKGAPIIRIDDLSKTAGDTAEMDLFHNLNGRPTMGDRKLEGRGEGLDKTEFKLSIDQGRHLVDAGGKMTQQRTNHNLVGVAKALLGNYYNDLQDEIAMYHLAGARGSYEADTLIVPLDTDSEFQEIMVNEVQAPTYDRHVYGGDATSFQTIDAADVMSLDTIENLSLLLEEQENPIRNITFEADEMAEEDPLYILFVTPRQWEDLWNSMTDRKVQELMAKAMKRGQGFKHRVFKGDVIMWRNILVRKYKKPVRFYAGDNVAVSQNNNQATTSLQTASVTIDRAILLGGQALANAYGKTEKSGNQFSMNTEKTDHGNGTETSICWMNGMKKVRVKSKSGRMNDFGSMVVDTAVTGL